MNWRFVADRSVNPALAVLFLSISARLGIFAWTGSWIGLDAQIYYRGSAAWLAGGNSWEALGYFRGNPAHYAALSTTVVHFAPFALLPEQGFAAGFIAVRAVAAVLAAGRRCAGHVALGKDRADSLSCGAGQRR